MDREMKDSGIEWIGEIPNSWGTIKNKYCSYIKGRIGWQGLRADEFINEGPYLVTGTDFINGRVNWDSCVHITVERYNEAVPIQLKEDDLLITKDGSIGKLAIVKNKPEHASLNSGIFVVRPINNLYVTKYLYYVLSSQVFNDFFAVNQGGTTIVHLYQETFMNFVFPIPSISEQQAIANYLDRKCLLIDSIIENQKAVIEKLKLYKQSIITEAVTKGLDPTIQMKSSGIEWIGDIPEGWEFAPLTKQLDSIIDYRGKTPTKVDDGVFLVTAKNIKDGRINYEASKEFVLLEEYEEIMRRGKPEIGDVLVTTEAPLGEVANVDRTDIALAQRIIKFRASNHKLDNYYLKYWLISRGFNSFLLSLSTGSTAAGIKASKLFMLPIILPSIPEQRVIVEYLDNKCVLIDNSIDKKQNLIDKLTEYKQSLICECVTGKREVV